MIQYIVFILLLAAVAGGFWLGRRSSHLTAHSRPKDYSLHYYKGLSYLFNEQPDSAIDAFIGSLEVNSETLDTHLALGSMLRRRGEVSKAIKIHQNLLARPSLASLQQHEAQFELARDYIKSGLLDRAEALLLELVKISSQFKMKALECLIEIYQDENEWDNAIKMANQLDTKHYRTKTGQTLNELQAHFACEQAQEDLHNKNPAKARAHLREALGFYRNSVRASLLYARLEYDQARYGAALKHLHKIPQQDPEYLGEALALICECYEKQGKTKALNHYLQELLTRYPSNSLIIKIAERMRRDDGDKAAAEFVARQLQERPSIKTLSYLIELHQLYPANQAQENLELLKTLVDKVVAAKPSYCCVKCGFTGNRLHWLCPSCKSWGTVQRIKGIAGE